VEKESLILRVNRVGQHLRRQLESAVNGKQGITGVTGLGTSLFINTSDETTAQQLHSHLLKQGVITGLNGSRGVHLKPALIMEEKHADVIAAAVSKF
jgi:4-aminobutyrate aminotransferase-like enzyme